MAPIAMVDTTVGCDRSFVVLCRETQIPTSYTANTILVLGIGGEAPTVRTVREEAPTVRGEAPTVK